MGKLLKLIISLAALAILAGCTTTQWVKTGANQSDFYVDDAQCNVQALSARVVPFVQNQIKSECLKGKGWYLTESGTSSRKYTLDEINSPLGKAAGQSCRRESDCQSGLSCRSISGGGAACR